MELRYRDIKNQKDEWSHLEVEVPAEVTPTLRIFSGGKNQFKIQGNHAPICWGTIDKDFYGVSFLRNDNDWPIEQMPVPPIRSNDIEHFLETPVIERGNFWAKFFAKALALAANSPFYRGKWILTDRNTYIVNSTYDLPVSKPTPENRAGLYQSRPLYLDWGMNGNFIVVALKSIPAEEDGRVKWWRKQVRNGSCPPVLIWWVSCLQAYVVLDGHARLLAYVLEGKTPVYMVLRSVVELKREPDLATAKDIEQSFEKRQQHKWKTPLTVDEMNEILIKVYDTRPFINDTTYSLAIHGMEAKWQEEVKAFSGTQGTDEEVLSGMLS